jgi:hypothetical protein
MLVFAVAWMIRFAYLNDKIYCMDTNPTTTTTTTQYAPPPSPAPPSRGMFGTKIPSSVAFAVAVLLFFMPFVDIKCNNMSLQQVSGFQLATGFKMKNSSSDNPFLDDVKSDKVDQTITKTTTKSDSKDPNLYAMIAMGLGILGLLLSFTNAKAAIGVAVVCGIGGAAAMIGMMLDIKNKVKMPSMNGATKGLGTDTASGGLSDKMNDFGKELGDKLNISVDFTPWFYVAVLAFIGGAIFCIMRMRSTKV